MGSAALLLLASPARRLCSLPLPHRVPQQHAAGSVGSRQPQQRRLALPRGHQPAEGRRQQQAAGDGASVEVARLAPGGVVQRCSYVVS